MKKFLNYTIEEQFEAVKKNGFAVAYIKNPSKEVCLEAVKEDGDSIRYIHNPSEQVCLEAVKEDGDSIRYIEKYYKSVAEITDDEDYKNLGKKVIIVDGVSISISEESFNAFKEQFNK